MLKQITILITLFLVSHAAGPTGCTYDGTFHSTGVYTCVKGSYTAPLAYGSFSSPLAQRLKITSFTGSFTGQFSGFSSFSTGSFDVNYPASLEIECSSSGTLTLSSSSFTDMGYLQEVTIRYCAIASLASGMLSPFGTLNSLRIEGGSVTTYSADFLTGLTIVPVTTAPEPKGEFVIKDCTLAPTTVPTGAFDALTKARKIQVENTAITTLDSAAFSLTVAVTDLSLADNAITTLDNSIVNSLNGLSNLNLAGNPYDCSCTNLGVLEYASKNLIRTTGPICKTPASYENKKAAKYYSDSCVTTVDCAHIAIGPTCMTIYEIIGSSLSFVTLIVSTIALVIICHTRRQLSSATASLEKKRNSGWSKVKDTMQNNRSVKPPMKGASAVHNGR